MSCMGTPQHSTSPSPGLMQSTSVPHFSHWNRLPNWFDISYPRCYCFCCIGTPQQAISPSPALVTIISVPHLLHWYRLPT